MRVLSLGAGVQSSTLLLMVRHGELDASCAIFADTQWEPAAVYRWLDWLDGTSTIPIYRVTAGAIRQDALSGNRFASMPVYTAAETKGAAEGRLRRQCTREYKVEPITRLLRQLAPGRRTPGQVQLLMGISVDELGRVKQNRQPWIENVYPLVDRRMSRHDCVQWLTRHGYPTPPKSACIGCPFHTDANWRRLRDESPLEFADAVDFDQRIRQHRIRGQIYLHRSLQPLGDVDLSRPEDAGQLNWLDECEGVCGV